MILIAHRGNTKGSSPRENHPQYIDDAIEQGYDVEVDVWFDGRGDIYLGHDGKQWSIDLEWINARRNRLWCHAKNLRALQVMLSKGIHCFAQEHDPYAVTSQGYIFTHSSMSFGTERSIMVDLSGLKVLGNVAGVCSDYVENYK